MAEPRALGRPPRSQDEKVEARNSLIEVARGLFVKAGFESVSIRKITAKAGISPMAFYQYFPSKRALLWHIMIDIADANIDRCNKAMDQVSLPEDKLRAFGQSFVNYWLSFPDHFRVVYLNEATGSIEDRASFLAAAGSMVTAIKTLADLVSAATKARNLSSHNATTRSEAYLSLLHGITLTLITIPEYPWSTPDKLLDEAIETFLRGCLTEAP